ncbi:MAG: asparagine synthase (glutamine-hydrolyzing) [Sulfuritalea sp.]|nr:asparagine synthase (glutamine-hydrolyzing) [Sulfuritalea sp.]
MCGIVGILGAQEPEWILRMNDAIHHRGPDAQGVFQEGDVSLAMRRLAIIDIGGGRQPMLTADKRFVLVYNGEIYNAAKLRRGLERDGAVFATDHSDTEVLLQLLIRKGVAALNDLNGMFAFAFYDRQQRTLLCARDRLGIKPFYYACRNGRLALASELKALLELPYLERDPDLQSLFHYFSLMYVPGEATALAGVSRLAPGHWLRYQLGGNEVETGCWWTPEFPAGGRRSRRDVVEAVREAIGAAVERWSIADVPVGCLLSGGLDSSAIVSLLARRGHHLKTFTVGFGGPGEADWDELQLARQVAQKWGTEHQEIILDPASLLDDLVDMTWHLDEPYGGGLPSWAVFKAMSREVKVAMTGTGGDELFGNYQKFVPLEGRLRSRLPGMGRRAADRGRFGREFFDRFYYASDQTKREQILTDRFRGATDTADLLWTYFSSNDSDGLRDRAVRVDLATQLPEEFLMMTDRFSMAYSVEARTPLLDHELVESVYAIDASVRLDARSYKSLLREAVADLLPPDLLAAPKKGFVIPLSLWLRHQLRPLVEALLAPARLKDQGLVRPDFRERFALPHLEGKADHTTLLWGMLMFQLWWELFIARRPREELSAWIRELA